jgi:gamma-glutamyltranspeptidase/glutathione hydrolase
VRDFTKQGRSMAVGENGMICTSHPAASMAGLDMLRSGGNAVDAALTAIAVLAVVEPHMTGIGGDCFALFSMGGAAPIALDGSGRAPGAATAEWYADRDIREIPPTSAHAVTIPGAISAWCTLNRDHGSKPLSEILAPAIRLAEEGMRVTPRVAWDWGRQIEKLSTDPHPCACQYSAWRRPRRRGRILLGPSRQGADHQTARGWRAAPGGRLRKASQRLCAAGQDQLSRT